MAIAKRLALLANTINDTLKYGFTVIAPECPMNISIKSFCFVRCTYSYIEQLNVKQHQRNILETYPTKVSCKIIKE